MPRASHSASACRRSKPASASVSASSSSRAKASRTRCSNRWKTTRARKSVPTKCVASPASLKGVLAPREAAMLLASGMRRVDGVQAIEAPVADGGEGMADVIHGALGGEWRTAVVSDPLGRAVPAQWLLLDDGTAVIDCAEAIGLPLLRPEEPAPVNATSRGLGELLLAT